MATNPSTTVTNPPDPLAPKMNGNWRRDILGEVREGTFARKDPESYAKYQEYTKQAEDALYQKYYAEEVSNFGKNASTVNARKDAIIDARAAAKQRFATEISSAGAGVLVSEQITQPVLPEQPQPPSSATTPVTPASNPQVPGQSRLVNTADDLFGPVSPTDNPQVPAARTLPSGRPILPLTDNGGSFNRQVGDVRADGAVLTQFLSNGTPVFVIRPAATPTAVTPASNPQVIGERTTVTETFDRRIFGERDPAGFREFRNYEIDAQRALRDKYLAEERARLPAGAILGSELEQTIDRVATQQAEDAARQRFAPQIIAAGAGTSEITTTPILAQQPQPPTSPSNTAPVSPAVNPQVPGNYPGTVQNPAQLTPPGVAVDVPEPVDPAVNPQVAPVSYDSFGNPTPVGSPAARSADISAAQAAADQTAAGANNANLQGQIQAQSNQDNAGDWRVKLRLAPSANYLYKAKEPGILQALAVTNGVVFPYTPKISTSYTATYNPYDLTHSNVRGYFYQGSHVGEVKINAVFTAQDTSEANYLLAVIHFFRSVTKMFYGQDQQYRGSPPPLVFLQGLGEYQFSNHPCVVSQFDYTLPDDVDYIRARSVSVSGTNLLQRRARSDNGFGAESTSADRLESAGLTAGGLYIPPAPPTLGVESPTYVPTKMEIAITLLPIQTRAQVSQQFSLEKFGNGNLQKGGFW